MSRRRFLSLAGVAGLAGLLWPAARAKLLPGPDPQRVRRRVASRRNGAGRWSEPSTWDGAPPRAGDQVVIDGRVVLDHDRHVAGLVIQTGGELIFAPSRSVTLSSDGNVVVHGVLTMRPDRPRIRHTLVFPSVDERSFVGGGMDVLASDVGLWVMGAGRLDLAGASRTPWVRAAAIDAGSRRIDLAAAPVGWRPGDTVVITPTVPPTQQDHSLAYDTGVIATIRGSTVTLARPTIHDHPAIPAGRGQSIGAEVLNLSRNVRIEGTKDGRAHVFIRSTSPQSVRGTALRHVGPRHGVAGSSAGVLGRYGIHLHMCEDGSRGSVFENVVVADAGSHAFAPHMSHGVTMKGCVSHNTFDGAFWYDGSQGAGIPGDPTNDLSLLGCVASLVQVDPPFRGYRVSGFSLDRGDGNRAVGCVAVGIQGNKEASGFGWPQQPRDFQGNWVFEDNLAHNNAVSGIFVWQNTDEANYVRRFTAFHNGVAGIDHGSYLSSFVYEDCTLFGNLEAGVVLHADSRDTPQLVFSRLHVHGSGFSPYGFAVARHSVAGYSPTRIDGSSFRGHKIAGIAWIPNRSSQPEIFDVLNCTFDGNAFWLASNIDAASRIHVQDAVRGSITLRRGDQPGTFVPEWNASTTTD